MVTGGSWELSTPETLWSQESISFLFSLTWAWAGSEGCGTPLVRAKLRGAVMPEEGQSTPRTQQFAGTAWNKVAPANTWEVDPTPLSKELRCACPQKPEQQHHFASGEAGKTIWSNIVSPSELQQSFNFEWSWYSPWYLWTRTNRAKPAAALLVVPLPVEMAAKHGWEVQESCPAHRSHTGCTGSPQSCQILAQVWKRCWWRGCAARPWQHLSRFILLGEEKHPEINISGF